MSQNPIDQFRGAITAIGLVPPNHIYDDGKIHRFSSSGKPKETNGWYVLFPNDGGSFYAGEFGCHRLQMSQTWHQNINREHTKEEKAGLAKKMTEAKRLREEEDKHLKEDARKEAERIWGLSPKASDEHEYLKRKGIKAHGLREHKGSLVVRVTNNGVLHSLQFIHPSGTKKFLKDGRIKGCYFTIGDKPEKVLCISESYSTAASIYEATGFTVVVTFNAGNLLSVAQTMHDKFPAIKLIICADDDWLVKDKDGALWNPGLTKAREAALVVGGLLAIPEFGEDRPDKATDFNDMAALHGVNTVKDCILRAAPVNATASEIISANSNPVNGVALICAKDIKPQCIDWLWWNHLAAGKLHLIAGMPGTGKTTIALSLAAIITTAGTWPDRTSCKWSRKVLIWSGEDDIEDTLVPRLLANGADRSKVFFVMGRQNGKDRPFDPASDMPELLKKAKDIGNVGLIVIDPIVSAVRGDSNKNSDVRNGLQPIVDLAQELKAAVIGITHFSKGGEGRNPGERVTGSVAFVAQARIVFATSQNSNSEGDVQASNVFTLVKSNVSKIGGGFYYDFEQAEVPEYAGMKASKIVWQGEAEGTATQLLSSDREAQEERRNALAEAKEFIRATLANGPIPSADLLKKYKEAGISKRTFDRAKVGVARSCQLGGVWVTDLIKADMNSDCQAIPQIASLPYWQSGNLKEKTLDLNSGFLKDEPRLPDCQTKRVATWQHIGNLSEDQKELDREVFITDATSNNEKTGLNIIEPDNNNRWVRETI